MRHSHWKPRVLMCLAVLGLMAGLDCSENKNKGLATLDFKILTQPKGGYGVQTVSCTFTGKASDPLAKDGDLLTDDAQIRLSAVWHSSHGTYNRSDFTWYADGQVITETVSKSAPEGMYLDKEFWVEFYWEDAIGTHSVKSESAVCL